MFDHGWLEPNIRNIVVVVEVVRGCPHITSAAGGVEGVGQMLTMADEGGRGGKPNADHC